ncbi:MAG: DNA adenine methylase [Candidatus Promineifilaceae bacterium]
MLSQYQPYLPPLPAIRHYYEPFIGSAALFFHLRPAHATLSDVNASLIELYQQVQQNVEDVIRALQPHYNDHDYYYQVRAQDPATLLPAQRAARLIFLNKTCYNGLYRENRQGAFNVPFGRYKRPKICDPARLRAAAAALQGVTLLPGDFAEVVQVAAPGDFVYFDPPYAPLTATSSFTSYNQYGFDAADQRRLAQTVHDLTRRGCRVMLSNSAAPLVYELYEGHGYRLIPIMARRNINSKASNRGPIKELLIVNYDLPAV